MSFSASFFKTAAIRVKPHFSFLFRYTRYIFAILDTYFAILDSCLANLDTYFAISDTCLAILDSHFAIIDFYFTILDSYFAILDTFFTIPDSYFAIIDTCFAILVTYFAIPCSLQLFHNSHFGNETRSCCETCQVTHQQFRPSSVVKVKITSGNLIY